MLPACIFCENESGSEEHLWAAWIHRRAKFGPIRVQEGTDPEQIDVNPERTINTVCHPCNNTWMSQLEQKNIPTISNMLDNKPTMIDVGRQRLFVEWAVKTAMVMDSIKDRHGDEKFYTRAECVALRLSQKIPKGSRMWIGALTESHLGAFGTDFTIVGNDQARIGTGIANTIIVGHLALQMMTIHMRPGFSDIPDIQPKQGDWDNMLIQGYPNAPKKVNWPPKIPFTNGGPRTIALLADRWRIGRKVPKISND
jgi:hypothetical protein